MTCCTTRSWRARCESAGCARSTNVTRARTVSTSCWPSQRSSASTRTRRRAVADGLDIAFFGSSLVSSWWNGACTYYRGIIRGLHGLGHHVTFYEPIAYERQEHRDIPDPDYARVVIYPAEREAQVRATVERAADADVVIKTSVVGAF